MKKRILSLILVFILSVTCGISVFATVGYMPGEIAYTVEENDFKSGDEASYSAEGVTFEIGGKAEFEFFLPFDSESVKIDFEATENTVVTYASIHGEETISLDFTLSSTTYTFATVQRKGEYSFSLSSDKAALIKSITFNKAKVKRPASGIPIYKAELSENDEAIMSAVIIDRKASVVLVNGGKRYIDYSDAAMTGDIIDGRLYLPAHTVARALGYYIEDYPEKHYILLRHDRVEYCFTNILSYREFYNGYDTPLREEIANPIIYKNGKAYLPVREFAEAIGKTVGFKDGIAVIDDKFSVENIINNETVFAYVKSLLSPFYPKAKTGRTIYVSQNHPSASDDGLGTQSLPYKTLSRAAEVAKAGDTVLIGSGTYRETLTPQNSGTETNPIIFKAEEDAEVIISALNEVSGFTEENGIVSAPLSWDMGRHKNQVFYNGEVLLEARYPDGPQPQSGEGEEAYDKSWPVQGDLRLYTNPDSPSFTGTQYVVSDTLLGQNETDYWKGGTFIGLFGECYWLEGEEILASENGRLTIAPQRETTFDNSETHAGWGWGYIVGHENCMNLEGEWIVKDGTLKMIAPNGASAESMTVEVKRRQLVVDLTDREFIHIEGIKTIGGSFLLKDSNMCVVNDCEILYNNHFLSDDGCDRGNTSESGSMANGENGIYVSGTCNAFVNNDIKEAAGAAICATGTYQYLENNYIENCGYSGYIASLNFVAEGFKDVNTLRGGHSVIGNTVARSGRCVMLHGSVGEGIICGYIPEEIAFNDFHDGFVTALDAGITYEYFVNMGVEKLKTRYHNNYVYTTRPKSNNFCFGIYHDGGAESIDTYNNVIFTTQSGVKIWSGGGDTAVYTQQAETSWADCDTWNNSSLTEISGGPSGLSAKDFPDEKPFYAGAQRSKDRFMLNYNAIVNDEEPQSKTYYAKAASYSDSSALQNGAAHLKPSAWMSFTVDLGTSGANCFRIGYLADKYKDGGMYQIIIGDTLTNGDSYIHTFTPRAAKADMVNIENINTSKYTGKQTVWIRCLKDNGTAIVSLKPRYY